MSPKVKRPRLVAPENRQRAAYSCDRCKTKKIKCIRVKNNEQCFDKSVACSSCLKSKQQCVTALPRRRRVYGSFENLGIHYQTILTLIQGLYPDIDINDVNELVKLGEKMGIKMPNVNDINNDDLNKIELENKILKPFIPKVDPRQSNSPTVTTSTNAMPGYATNPDHPVNHYQISETVIMDAKGGSHYVGSAGTPVLFSVLCKLLLKRSYRTTLSFDNEIKLFQPVKNEQKEMIDQKLIYELLSKEKRFPFIHFITKEEATFYTDHFFKFFHPFYFIFDESSFRVKHDLYWKFVEDESLKYNSEELTSTQIGSIYLVWILGSRLVDLSMRNLSLESQKMDEVLKFFMADAALGSNLSSIQFLFLYSVNLHANKNRDSAWNIMGLAIRQSISLGLHRRMITSKKEYSQIKDLQIQIFWSLYQYELTLCSTFGRPSNINEDEIDIDYPDLSKNNQVSETFKVYFVASLKLSRFLNKIVKDRKISAMSHLQPISLISIERTLSMKNQLNQIHSELNIKCLKDVNDIFDYKLNLRFHFYMVLLILPFLLHITTANFNILQDETLLSILKTGIQSAIFVSKLMKISVTRHFNYGALSTDCMYGYASTLVLSLFFIYLSNGSNDMQSLEIEFEDQTENIDKKLTLDYITNIIEFMHNSQLDSTTKRICEVIEGIKNDLKLVEIQDDLRFDTLNFEGTDQMVYDSLFMSNEIYLDGNII